MTSSSPITNHDARGIIGARDVGRRLNIAEARAWAVSSPCGVGGQEDGAELSELAPELGPLTGSDLGGVCDALDTILSANRTLADYHRERRETLARPA